MTETLAEAPTYGILGTGLMGAPLAQRLHEAELEVTIYNRTTAKMQPLAELGIGLAGSPGALVGTVDCVILMLSDGLAIRETLLGADCRGLLAGKTVIQMGTIGPSESVAIAAEVTAAGGSYLEAPVLGSIPQVKTGTLLLMVGSTTEQFEKHLPLFKHLGETPQHIGEVGQAMALKLALNQLIAGLTNSFALSLAFAQQQNVPLDAFMGILRESALYAPTFDKKLDRMVDGNFANPNFPVKHLLKDVRLFLKEAEVLALDTQALAGSEKTLEAAIAMGLGEMDYSALFAAVSQIQP
jgi:3-hydroxyisobutyrate dehydrogenase